MTKKLCLFCEHFTWEQISDYEGNEFTCDRDYLKLIPSDNEAQLRKLMRTAETCPDYVEVTE